MLLDLAREQAEPSQESDVWTKIYELEARIKVLEGSDNPADLEVVEGWKEGKWYHNGDKCSWNGKTYICANVPENSVCVWSPETMPQYWTEIVSETNGG